MNHFYFVINFTRMGYLRLYDYISCIQTPTFNQLLQSNDAKRILKEAVAKALITSYIVQQFDVEAEFTDTTLFSKTAIYKAQSLVELNFPAYATATTYTGIGTDFITETGKCYVLKTPGATGTFDPSKWTLLGDQYDLYYVAFPYEEFEVTNYYKVGDIVFWKGKIYKCLIATNIPSHFGDLQDIIYANIPLNNIFPDNAINGPIYWGTGVAYSVSGLIPNNVAPAAWMVGAYTAGTRVLLDGVIWIALVNNSIKPGLDITNWQPQTWTFGDNRNPQIVECMIWITIDKLAPLISPRTAPIFWDKKYNEMVSWLQMCADGIITLDVPQLQPAQGRKIRFGGNVKQINGY